ncbi:MAG TPA: hypothetical protein VEG30_10870 [Terriglobales bacterium]|nr:hypothetical protein [Terriglobales bacterium]
MQSDCCRVLALSFLLLTALASAQPGSGNVSGSDHDTNQNDTNQNRAQDQQAQEFSEQVVRVPLDDLRNGLEGHSLKITLQAFDGDKMDNYPKFTRDMQAFFDTYEAFRVHFKVLQSSGQGPRGAVLLNFDLEKTPVGGGPVVRKSAQVRFELEYGRQGWRIVRFQPREFLS